MKLQFNKDLKYQEIAVSSVVDLFRGQTPMESNFTVSAFTNQVGIFDTENGIGNKFELNNEEILKNLQEIQLRNGLPQTHTLKNKQYDFDIEMETGTGKTYVYLRTIFELHKNYGFSKFIIVVPSIAIKEGTYKSLQITKEHFKLLFENTIYNYFIYDSSKLEQVRSFAVSDNIEIMVINIDAFKKSFDDPEKENKANIIHRPNDKLNGMKPIELIKETNPIVIIDEPQSVDTTPKSKEAIKSLNPLCTLRYSATHVEKHNLVYKLDAVDSYNLELVKQIEVAGFETKDYHNKAYLKLISVNNKKSPITAKIEIDIKDKKGVVTRKSVTVKRGTDLYEKSGFRDVYEGYIINEIYCEEGNEFVSFTSNEDILLIGKVLGNIEDITIKEHQIKKTIEEHLDKELILNKQGIKVLSLFFIDKVSNYRYYDEEGNPQKGIYADIFEKHYKQLIKLPKYRTLFNDLDDNIDVSEVHNGYFSTDKKGKLKDTSGATAADEDVYNLIMKDKERLLSFETKLRFIFSHSALREGWDNPNVFQICTLNETKSEVKKRQEIGRGMRLCVNQQGERQHGFAINTLTVIANESYEQFAEALQKEYEEESGIRFGIMIKNNKDKKKISLNKKVYLDPEFKELWDRIKYKTTYSVEFDSSNLIDECCKAMENISITSSKLVYTKATLDINKGGVYADEEDRYAVSLGIMKEKLPDIISYLQNETNLTRKTIVDILIKSNTIHLFKKNPQRYMEQAARIIRSKMRLIIVDGIKYTKIGDEEYYAQELFEEEELTGYLSKNMLESKKSVYDYVVYDSNNEEKFAERFEKNNQVKLYAKLPDWFKISTPLGSYNPDWAVLIDLKGQDKLYFVLETKGSILTENLRPAEEAKIKCGHKHFEALGCDIVFEEADDFNEFIEKDRGNFN